MAEPTEEQFAAIERMKNRAAAGDPEAVMDLKSFLGRPDIGEAAWEALNELGEGIDDRR